VRTLYEAFEHLIASFGPYEARVTKTAIAFKGAVRGFAGATPRSRTLAGFLDLMHEVHEPPFTRVTPYTSRLWVHRFVLERPEQLDDQFGTRVAEAYRVGAGDHRV
jgi:hypothetical protein